MSFPEPYPGLVIRYAYLWKREFDAGREEGTKDRPCAIVMTVVDEDGDKEVLVLTHTPPADRDDAIEIPAATRTGLGTTASDHGSRFPMAFLIHAVRNLAIDHYRRERSLVGREVQIDDVDRQHPLIAPDPTPDQILDSQQRLDQLTTILDAVSRRTRAVYLAHRSGYTYAEIADDMGITEITIKRHIARAHLAIMKHDETEP